MRLYEFVEDGQKGGRLSATRLAGLSLVYAAILLAAASVLLAWHDPTDVQPLWFAGLVGELLVAGLTALGLRAKGSSASGAEG